MSNDRYLVMGLASPRSEWFSRVSLWCATTSIPVNFSKLLSASEAAARLESGRRYSALLIDSAHPALDRELVQLCIDNQCALVVVDGDRTTELSDSLNHLNPKFTQDDLLLVLATHSRAVSVPYSSSLESDAVSTSDHLGTTFVFCGASAGTSTISAAAAQILAESSPTVLVDMSIRPSQRMYHDIAGEVRSVEDLFELSKTGYPQVSEIHDAAIEIPNRSYKLITGLRRSGQWTQLGGASVQRTIREIRLAFPNVVIDTDPTIELTSRTGSPESEQRFALSNQSLRSADVVGLVIEASVHGVFVAEQILADLIDNGISSSKIVPIFNRCGRYNPGSRDFRHSWVQLISSYPPIASAVLSVREAHIDSAQHDVVQFPRKFMGDVATVINEMKQVGHSEVLMRLTDLEEPSQVRTRA